MFGGWFKVLGPMTHKLRWPLRTRFVHGLWRRRGRASVKPQLMGRDGDSRNVMHNVLNGLAFLFLVACQSASFDVCLSAVLHICLSVCLAASVCSSVSVYVCLFVCIAICMSAWVALCFYVCLSVYMCVRVCVSKSVCLSDGMSFFCLSVYLFQTTYTSACLSVYIWVCLAHSAHYHYCTT